MNEFINSNGRKIKIGDLVYAYHTGIFEIESFYNFELQYEPAIGVNLVLLFDKNGNPMENKDFTCNATFCQTLDQKIEDLQKEIKEIEIVKEKIFKKG